MPFRGDATKVAGVESGGFVLGTAPALALGVGLVPIRKGEGPGDRVLLVDDWVETGSQASAAARLVVRGGAELLGVAVVVLDCDPGPLAGLGRAHALVPAGRLG